MNLQQGNLVKVLHNGKEGIGYIYDNEAPDEKDIVLQIGISWKDGGTSNSSVPEAIKEGVEFQVVELKRTFEEVLLETAQIDIDADETTVLDYFEFMGIDTEDQCFSIVQMAKETGIQLGRLVMLLSNLEDDDIMNDIVHGDYTSFDQYDRNQFNDSYPFE